LLAVRQVQVVRVATVVAVLVDTEAQVAKGRAVAVRRYRKNL
jgi:hypothetical protein